MGKVHNIDPITKQEVKGNPMWRNEILQRNGYKEAMNGDWYQTYSTPKRESKSQSTQPSYREYSGGTTDSSATGCLGFLLIVVFLVLYMNGGIPFLANSPSQPPSTYAPGDTSLPSLPEAERLMHVASSGLHVRIAPGVDRESLTILRKGTEVELLGETQIVGESVWVQIKSGQGEGWVNKRYLE